MCLEQPVELLFFSYISDVMVISLGLKYCRHLVRYPVNGKLSPIIGPEWIHALYMQEHNSNSYSSLNSQSKKNPFVVEIVIFSLSSQFSMSLILTVFLLNGLVFKAFKKR